MSSARMQPQPLKSFRPMRQSKRNWTLQTQFWKLVSFLPLARPNKRWILAHPNKSWMLVHIPGSSMWKQEDNTRKQTNRCRIRLVLNIRSVNMKLAQYARFLFHNKKRTVARLTRLTLLSLRLPISRKSFPCDLTTQLCDSSVA